MFMFGLIGILIIGNHGRSDLAQLRLATVQFQQLEAVQAGQSSIYPLHIKITQLSLERVIKN